MELTDNFAAVRRFRVYVGVYSHVHGGWYRHSSPKRNGPRDLNLTVQP